MEIKQQVLEQYLIQLREDKAILGQIYDVTYGAIFAFVMSIIKDKETAKDITHDVYLAIYQNCHQYQAKGHPMAWLYAIARNTTNMYLRKHKNVVLTEEEIEIPAQPLDIVGNVTVEYMLKYLDEEEREIVVMRSLSELSFLDIAKTLDLRLSTVLSKYHRAIKKLRKHVMEVSA